MKYRLPIIAATLAVAFGILGSVMLSESRAETFAVPSEAEAGVVGGTATVMDQTAASAGKSVRFGSADNAVLTFAEEFNAPAGTKPDPAKWEYDLGPWNNELQTYTSSADNASTDGNGNMVITARKTSTGGYTSARFHTDKSFSQAYGSFEARMKLPNARGLLPAFWMLGSNFKTVEWPACGEIDILEVPGDGKVHMSLHGYGDDDGVGLTGSYGTLDVAQWHVYRLEWTPSAIKWLIDGTVVRTVTKQQAGTMWSFDNPEFLILSLAVGGWSGTPPSTTPFPSSMLIDYVRAYKL